VEREICDSKRWAERYIGRHQTWLHSAANNEANNIVRPSLVVSVEAIMKRLPGRRAPFYSRRQLDCSSLFVVDIGRRMQLVNINGISPACMAMARPWSVGHNSSCCSDRCYSTTVSVDQRPAGASSINAFKGCLSKTRKTRMGFFMD